MEPPDFVSFHHSSVAFCHHASASIRLRFRIVNAVFTLLVPLFAVWTGDAIAQRNQLRPGDFEPLTELPWESPGATPERVLDRIFREPNPTIRYPVLAEYLRTSGSDGFTDDAMADRTFCSLRVWAVVRPKEMEAWTQEGR